MRASLNVVHAGLVAAVVLVSAWSGTASAARHHGAWKSHGRPFLADWVRSFKPAFTMVERGYYGAWANPTLLAARSECEWTEAMSELAARGALIILPAPEAPPIDWSRQTAVLVALGLADGYSVDVRHVSHIGGQLFLDVHVEQDRRQGKIDVSPYVLVAVDTKRVDAVVARYDWAPLGLPTSGIVSGCSSTHPSKADRRRRPHGSEATEPAAAAGSDEAPSTVTWGALKSRYR